MTQNDQLARASLVAGAAVAAGVISWVAFRRYRGQVINGAERITCYVTLNQRCINFIKLQIKPVFLQVQGPSEEPVRVGLIGTGWAVKVWPLTCCANADCACTPALVISHPNDLTYESTPEPMRQELHSSVMFDQVQLPQFRRAGLRVTGIASRKEANAISLAAEVCYCG